MVFMETELLETCIQFYIYYLFRTPFRTSCLFRTPFLSALFSWISNRLWWGEVNCFSSLYTISPLKLSCEIRSLLWVLISFSALTRSFLARFLCPHGMRATDAIFISPDLRIITKDLISFLLSGVWPAYVILFSLLKSLQYFLLLKFLSRMPANCNLQSLFCNAACKNK